MFYYAPWHSSRESSSDASSWKKFQPVCKDLYIFWFCKCLKTSSYDQFSKVKLSAYCSLNSGKFYVSYHNSHQIKVSILNLSTHEKNNHSKKKNLGTQKHVDNLSKVTQLVVCRAVYRNTYSNYILNNVFHCTHWPSHILLFHPISLSHSFLPHLHWPYRWMLSLTKSDLFLVHIFGCHAFTTSVLNTRLIWAFLIFRSNV